MPHHFKVHELLSRDELDALEAFAREPGRTVDECYEWMLTRGFTAARSSIGRWKREFDGERMKERFSGSGELAAAIKSAVSAGDFGAIADAATMQLTQVVFEQATRLQTDELIDPLDVQRMTRSLSNLVNAKAKLGEKFDREIEVKLASKPNRTLTADDVAEIRRAVFG